MRRVVTALALVVACERSKPTDDCRTEAAALAKFLDDTPHEGQVFQHQRGLALVVRPDAKTVARIAPVIIVTADTVTYQGNLVDRSSLEERLRDTRAVLDKEAKVAGVDPRRIHLQIDRSVPWSKVVDAVHAAEAAGFTRPAFAFDTGIAPNPPPGVVLPNTDADLATAVETIRRSADAKPDTFFESCPPLAALLKDLGQHEGNERKDVRLIRLIAPALVECSCRIDLAAVRARMYRLLVEHPVIRVIAFDVPEHEELALPGATTWDKASQRLAPGKSYRFVSTGSDRR